VYGTFAQNPTGLPVFIPSAQQAVGKPYGWPMPFDPATGSLQIAFSLDSAGVVLFRVFTLEGRRVRELSQGFAAAGNQILSWDGTNDAGQKVSPGGYVGLITSPSGARQKFKIAVSPR
jgi:flagellar hook assembly protein FlgD